MNKEIKNNVTVKEAMINVDVSLMENIKFDVNKVPNVNIEVTDRLSIHVKISS